MAARKPAKAAKPKATKPRAKAKPKAQAKELIAVLVGEEARPEAEKPKPAQDEKGRFVSGNVGGGRHKGSRNKLGEAFTDALLADFEKATAEGGKTQGEAVIAKLRDEDPAAYVRTIAMIMPKQVDVRVSEFEEMTDEQLDRRIQQLASVLEIGTGGNARGEKAPQGKKPPVSVPPVH